MNARSLSAGLYILILLLIGCAPTDDAAKTLSDKSAGGSGSVAKRIVSLSPTATETPYEIGAGDRVTVVDSSSDIPKNAPHRDFSGLTPNPEAVIAEGPDLVTASVDVNGLGTVPDAADIGLLLLPAATTSEQAYDQIEQVGESTGHMDDAQKLVDRVKKETKVTVDSVDPETRDARLSYFHEADSILCNAGNAMFIGQTYSLFGLKSVAGPGDDYPQLINEAVIQINPDFIFLADYGGADGMTEEDVASRPGRNEIVAIKGKQIIPLDPNLASRWGPRLPQFTQNITEALKSCQQVPAPTQ